MQAAGQTKNGSYNLLLARHRGWSIFGVVYISGKNAPRPAKRLLTRHSQAPFFRRAAPCGFRHSPCIIYAAEDPMKLPMHSIPLIDAARADDIPAMVALLGELFAIERDFHPDPVRQARGLMMLVHDQQHAAVFVAKSHAGVILGMATAQLVISTAEGTSSAWVEDLVVQLAHRAQGIGRALLNRALQWARQRGATRAQLLLDQTNAPAAGFYQHLGWQATHLTARRIFLTHPQPE